MLQWTDRMVAAAVAAARWFVMPVTLLLFLQWPLRDLLHVWSREANDLAQWIFALYVAAAVTCATRLGRHLSADVVARRYRPATRRLIAKAGALLCMLPWAVFVLVTATPGVIQSVLQLERFPDSYDPGYFLVKLAVWLLAVLGLAQALLSIAGRGSAGA